MAFRIDASGENVHEYTAALPGIPASFFFRFRRRGTGGSSVSLLMQYLDSGYAAYYNFFIEGANVRCDGQGGSITGPALSTDVWYDVGIVCAGTGASDLRLYVGPTGTPGTWSSNTTQANTGSGTTEWGIGTTGATNFPNAAIEDIRVWSATLTQDELAAERLRRVPIRFTNLYRWHPANHATLADAMKDFSGNGRDLAATGTPTIEDGAPVGWGASIIVPQYAATSSAPVLSLPGVQDITATSARPKVTLTYA